MAAQTNVDELPTYEYVAIDEAGGRVARVMQAPSEEAVRRALDAEGWTALSIEQHKTNPLTGDLGALKARLSSGASGPKLKTAARAQFARQLYQLLKAGIQPGRAIAVMAEDATKEDLRLMLLDVSQDIMSGTPLADAFAKYPRAFDDVFVSYLASGEETGALEETVQRLAHILDKRNSLELKIKGVTAYPKMVSGIISLMVAGILWKIVPKFESIYNGFDAELPAPTKMVVAASEQLPLLVVILTAVIVGLVVAHKRTIDNLEIGRKLDIFKFKLPAFGKLLHKLALYRWASTLAGALHSGIHMDRGLDLAARASASRWIKLHTTELRDAVTSGRPLSATMIEYPKLFPPTLRNMIATGEEAGEVPDMLESAASALDDEVDMIVSSIGAKIEVGLLVVMGGVVGAMLVALYLPVLNLTTTAADSMGF